MHSRRLSSRRRWISAFVVIAMVLLAGAAGLYRREAQRVRAELYENLAVVASMKAGQIQQWRHERAGDASVIAGAPFAAIALQRLRGDSLTGLDARMRGALRTAERTFGYTNVLLLSPSGDVLYSLHPARTIGPNTRIAVDSASVSTESVLSNLFRGEDNVVHFDATHAIRDTTGRVVGVLVLRTSVTTYLDPLLTDWPTGRRTATSVLLRQDGDNVIVLTHGRTHPADVVAVAVPVAERSLAPTAAALGVRGRFEGNDERGVRVLADVRPVNNSPWFLVTRMDETEVREAVWLRARVILVFAAVFALFIGAVMAYGYRNQQARLLRDLYSAERKEREAQAVFLTTFYSIGDAVITADREQRVTAMNRVAEQLTGWSDAAARGRPLTDVYRAVDETTGEPRDISAAIAQQLTQGEPKFTNHTKLLGLDAEYPIASTAAPIRDSAGIEYGTVLVFRDETKRREQQMRTLEEEKMASMGRLAGGIAHDFNNLLSIISGATELALADLPGDAPVRPDLEDVRHAAGRASALTRQLLAFSRRQLVEPQFVDVNALVRDVETMLARLLGSRIRLALQCAPCVASVYMDATQLEQVVMNLTINARDAMPEGGTIELTIACAERPQGVAVASGTLPPGEYVVITVRDSGAGMDVATRKRIFEPFFTTKGPGRGTGLGLATVHGIVQQAFGGIAVTSEPGRGSSFAVHLPRAERPSVVG